MLKMTENTIRQQFLKELIGFLDDKRYALMRNIYGSTENWPLSSDMDIAMPYRTMLELVKFLDSNDQVRSTNKLSLSFMTIIDVFFIDGSFLHLDLIFEFKRKSLVYMDLIEVLDAAKTNEEGIKVPQEKHDAEYLLFFYQLNKAPWPIKYRDYFKKQKEFEYVELFNKKHNLKINTLNDIHEPNNHIYNKLRNNLLYTNGNNPISWTSNTIFYVIDTFKKQFCQKGAVITLSGVDGAGKSTIISELKDSTEFLFRKKVKLLRHRPSILPILSSYVHGKENAEKRAAETLPRQGKNKSSISSLLRFTYYYLDYLLGQWYVHFKYVAQGYVVIYDRYYFDFINDARRSNINLSESFITKLYTFIKKPMLNVLLYAPAETILRRKQELSKEDIENLTNKYLNTFNNLSNKYPNSTYLAIQNIEKDQTLRTIINEYSKLQ